MKKQPEGVGTLRAGDKQTGMSHSWTKDNVGLKWRVVVHQESATGEGLSFGSGRP